MAELKADEITSVLRQQIEGFKADQVLENKLRSINSQG